MATIRDVAAEAGVAPSTVSTILSGRKRYPQPTVDRVMEAIARLGYRPDPAARALALGRTNVIGLLAAVTDDGPGPASDVFMRFVRAAVYAATRRGFDLLLMGRGDAELEGDVLADALVVMDIRHDDARLPVLQRRGLPTVLVGVPGDARGMSAFDLDFAEAARVAIRELASLGHRRIAVIASPFDVGADEFAYAHRFRDGLGKEAGRLGVDATQVSSGRGDDDLARWAEQVGERSAVVVLDVGVLDALERRLAARGLRVPEDVSLVVLAPAEELAQSRPGLTVVDIPGRRMVELAVERVVEELAGAEPGVQELLPAVLLDRGSVGPAPRTPPHL